MWKRFNELTPQQQREMRATITRLVIEDGEAEYGDDAVAARVEELLSDKEFEIEIDDDGNEIVNF